MVKTFHITTFGCQMNEHDSEIMAGMLTEMGLVRVEERKNADIVLLNTCSVRENADKRFFGTLGQLKHKKEEDPDFIVGVCGCMMQQQHIIDQLKEKYPWVDLVFGTHNISHLPALLKNVMREKKKIIEIYPDTDEIPEGLPSRRLHRGKALVNIMFGCNNFCTYCIVPYTRGREKSRHPEEILREIQDLARDGVREVMLLGQNVNSYRGKTEEDGGRVMNFAELVRKVAEIHGIQRIRFMTSHPKDLSDELIEVFRTCDKLCHNIHLPVQSGSNRILAKMNRKYTKESYLEVLGKLREAVPDITVSTDIIVGFPGETEEDFQETLDLVKKVRYDSAFTFLYSVRRGTPAEKFREQIPEDVKHERFNRLVDTINRISEEKNAAYEGKVVKVLVEGRSKRNSKALSGRTDGFKLVNFPIPEDLENDPDELEGKLLDVKITRARTFSLEGKMISYYNET